MDSPDINMPSTPAAPTTAESMQAYISGLPQMYQAQLDWNPKMAQQQVDMARQYAPQMKALQDELYPSTSALQENIATTAQAGMSGEMPDYMRDAYLDRYRAEVGNNAGSGIGADYVSRNMLNAGEDYRRYYQSLALSATGRQPLYQSSAYSSPNVGAGYNYGQVSSDMQSGYGNYVGSYANMYRSNADYAGTMAQVNQGYAQMGMQGAGAFMMSSRVMKTNIQDINNGLEIVNKLNGVSFNWKLDNAADGGVIAEEVEKILPDAVTDVNGIKHIKPMMIIGHLIEAVKELSEKLENIKAETQQ